MSSLARPVDWANPLARGLVDLWPGVQLVSAVKRWGAALNGAASFADYCGPIWRQNSQQLVNYGDSSPENFDRTDPFTVAFQGGWAALGANDAILNHSSDDAARRGWCVYKDASDAMRLLLVADTSVGNYAAASFTFSPVAGVLYRFVLVYDGSGSASGMACYVDARRLARMVVQDTLSGSTVASNYLRVGWRDTDGWGHNGWVRDVAIWRRALGPDEVNRFFADPGQLLARDPGLVWFLPPCGAVSTAPLAPLRTFVAGDGLLLSTGLG